MTEDVPELTGDVVELWRRVLGVDELGPDDDFFEMGGNSITAIRLLPLISDQFDVDVDALFVFDNPTPRQFAATLAPLTRGRVG